MPRLGSSGGGNAAGGSGARLGSRASSEGVLRSPAKGSEWRPAIRRSSRSSAVLEELKGVARTAAKEADLLGPSRRRPIASGRTANARSGGGGPAIAEGPPISRTAAQQNKQAVEVQGKIDRSERNQGIEFRRQTSRSFVGSPKYQRSTSSMEADAQVAALLCQSPERLAAVFLESTSEVESMLSDVLHGLRMERPREPDPDSRQEEEDARRQLEAEERQAARREQAARDPHRKVQLRLENGRRFEHGQPRGAPVPMVRVDFECVNGREQVALVDVAKLRARCKQLEEGASVDSLLALQEQQEAQRRFVRERSVPGSPLPGSPVSSPSIPAPARTLDPLNPCYQRLSPSGSALGSNERLRRARAQKQSGRLDGYLHQLGTMRGGLPRNALERLEALAQANSTKTMTGRLQAFTDGNHGRTVGFVNRAASTLEGLPTGNHPLAREITASLGLMALPRLVAMAQDDYSESEDSHLENWTEQFCGLASFGVTRSRRKTRSKRVQRLWRLLKGVTSVLLVYFAHRRRTISIGILAGFLREQDEKFRMKVKIKQIRNRIVMLQRRVRSFFALNKQRIAEMHKEWQRIEDLHLSKYFVHFIQEALGVNDSTATLKAPLVKRLCSNPFDDEALRLCGDHDWRKLRIPILERTALIERAYFASLRRQGRNKNGLQSASDELLTWERDIAVVTGESLAVTVKPEDIAALSLQRDFWQLSQDDVFDLIAGVADVMRKIEPYTRHPANKQPGPHNPFCRPLKDLFASDRALTKKSSKDVPANLEQSQEAAGLESSESSSALGADDVCLQRRPAMRLEDIDKLMNRFALRFNDQRSDLYAEDDVPTVSGCSAEGRYSLHADEMQGYG